MNWDWWDWLDFWDFVVVGGCLSPCLAGRGGSRTAPTGVPLEESFVELGGSEEFVRPRSTPACPCELASLARVPFRPERGRSPQRSSGLMVGWFWFHPARASPASGVGLLGFAGSRPLRFAKVAEALAGGGGSRTAPADQTTLRTKGPQTPD